MSRGAVTKSGTLPFIDLANAAAMAVLEGINEEVQF